MRYLYLGILLIVSTVEIQAQQSTNFTQTYINKYMDNPAYAGFNNQLSAYLHYRNEMLGVRGAPVSEVFTIDAPFQSYNTGIGFNVFSDKVNILERKGANISYSYHLKLPQKQFLRFGISLGVVNNSIAYNDIVAGSPNELLLIYNYKPATSFNSDLGIVYGIKKFEFSFAANNLLNRKKFSDSYLLPYRQNETYNISSYYTFEISPNLKAKPSLVIRSSKGMTPELAVNTLVEWQDFLWAGLSYHLQTSLGLNIGIKYNNFTFGYVFEYQTSDLSKVSNGAHEILIGYTFRKKLKKDSLYRNAYEESREYYPQRERYKKRNNRNNVINQNSSRKDTTVQLIIFEDPEQTWLRNTFTRDKNVLKNETKKYKVPLIDSTQIAEKIDSTEKGGKYVVIAAYLKFEDAKKHQRFIQRKLGLNTKIMQSSSKKFFFVTTGEVADFDNALQEFRRLKGLGIEKYIFGNLWMYAEKN